VSYEEQVDELRRGYPEFIDEIDFFVEGEYTIDEMVDELRMNLLKLLRKSRTNLLKKMLLRRNLLKKLLRRSLLKKLLRKLKM